MITVSQIIENWLSDAHYQVFREKGLGRETKWIGAHFLSADLAMWV